MFLVVPADIQLPKTTMASVGNTVILESGTNEATTLSKRVQQLINDFKGKTAWYLRLQLLKDEDVKEIARVLKSDENCEELHLNKNNITAVGIEYIVELLRDNRKLKKLNLKNNPIGDEGIQRLCNVLASNDTLLELNLSNTEMTYRSGEAVADMIKKTQTLKQLDLRQKEGLPPLTVRRIKEANENEKITKLLCEQFDEYAGDNS